MYDGNVYYTYVLLPVLVVLVGSVTAPEESSAGKETTSDLV
jgi:hypothetical protein